MLEAFEPDEETEGAAHVINDNGGVCDTGGPGEATPDGRSPLDLMLDATDGFVPLWAANTTLRWRINEASLRRFKRPDLARAEIRKLFGEGLALWGRAVPVKFVEDDDLWDFELNVARSKQCNRSGCVLATAFFPDGGQHRLEIFPSLFEESRREQVETMAHEVGHIFGLRHWFAKISETRWASEEFGSQVEFSIMNYGSKSMMTEHDRSDLTALYEKVWSGQLDTVNGTPVRLVRAFTAPEVACV